MPRTTPQIAPSQKTHRTAKFLARRDTIIDVSARVFAKSGFHGAGISELCEANELGKGALYHYIGSKEELLAAIHDRVMDEVLQSAERASEATGSPLDRLRLLGDELLTIISRYPDHVWVFLHEFPALTGNRAIKFRERRRRYEETVESILRDGQETGYFRDFDPRLAALAWLGMHNYTYLWLRPKGPLSAQEIAQRFADFFVNGITAN